MEKLVKTINSFTGWRFVMIAIIVISHLEFLKAPENFGRFAEIYSKYIWNSAFAVHFFFMVSGFGMMLGSIRRIPNEKLQFPALKDGFLYGIAHIKKIYPLYIITILIGLGFEVKSNWANYQADPLSRACLEAFRLGLSATLLQSMTGMSFFSHAYNGVGWFLSCLFCIYLVSPWLMFSLRKLSQSYHSDILLVLAEIVSSVAMTLFLDTVSNQYGVYCPFSLKLLSYVSPLGRVFEVMIGMTLAMAYCRLQTNGVWLSERKAAWEEWAIAGLVLIYQFCRNAMDASVGQKQVVDLILCGTFVFVFSFDSGRISRALSNKTMQKLGAMAMYIFLIHYPIKYRLGRMVEARWGWNTASAIIFILFEFVATYVLANILYTKSVSGKRDK